MTQDEIIRMARESGLGWVAHKRLERFAALVSAHEREACAKVCDEMANRYKTGTDMSHELLQIGFLAAEYGAYSIRKRGEK